MDYFKEELPPEAQAAKDAADADDGFEEAVDADGRLLNRPEGDESWSNAVADLIE